MYRDPTMHYGVHEGGNLRDSQERPEENGGRWYFSRKDIEENSPSRRDGIDLKKETYLRKSYCTFLQDLGMRLKVPQVTIATAIIFCHRFFLRQSHVKNDRRIIATVCMFLAGKVEETPRPLKDVIIVSYEIIHKKDSAAVQRIRQKEIYERQKEQILQGERVVLASLGFDLNVHHPYKPLVDAIKKFKVAQQRLAQVAWNFVNDGLRTSLCLQFMPHQIAAGAIFLAAKFIKVKLPSDGEKVWWQGFDVTPRQLEEVSNQMLELYEQNRVPPSQANEAEGSAAGNQWPSGRALVVNEHAANNCNSHASEAEESAAGNQWPPGSTSVHEDHAANSSNSQASEAEGSAAGNQWPSGCASVVNEEHAPNNSTSQASEAEGSAAGNQWQPFRASVVNEEHAANNFNSQASEAEGSAAGNQWPSGRASVSEEHAANNSTSQANEAKGSAAAGNQWPSGRSSVYEEHAATNSNDQSNAEGHGGPPMSPQSRNSDSGNSDHIGDGEINDIHNDRREPSAFQGSAGEAQNRLTFAAEGNVEKEFEGNAGRAEIRDRAESKDEYCSQTSECKDCALGQSPQEALKKIDKDKVKAAVENKVKAALEKRRKFQGDVTRKSDILDEDDLIEKELEDGIELTVESDKNKQERKQSWSKPSSSRPEHENAYQDEVGNGHYCGGSEGQPSRGEDLGNVEEGELEPYDDPVIGSQSPEPSNRKRKASSSEDRPVKGKQQLEYVAGPQGHSNDFPMIETGQGGLITQSGITKG